MSRRAARESPQASRYTESISVRMDLARWGTVSLTTRSWCSITCSYIGSRGSRAKMVTRSTRFAFSATHSSPTRASHIEKLPGWPNSASSGIKLPQEKSVLKLQTGGEIKLTEADFVRLSEAFFKEIEKRYV